MKATLWMKSSCSTCRKARTLLVELGIQAEVRDYFKQPLEPAELERLLPADPTPFLGTRSPKYKELGLQHRALSKAEAIALIVEDNNLLKRPILVHPKGVVIGLDADAYATLTT